MTITPELLSSFASSLGLTPDTIQRAVNGEIMAAKTVIEAAAVHVDDPEFVQAVKGLPDEWRSVLKDKIDRIPVRLLIGHTAQLKLLALL